MLEFFFFVPPFVILLYGKLFASQTSLNGCSSGSLIKCRHNSEKNLGLRGCTMKIYQNYCPCTLNYCKHGVLSMTYGLIKIKLPTLEQFNHRWFIVSFHFISYHFTIFYFLFTYLFILFILFCLLCFHLHCWLVANNVTYIIITTVTRRRVH